jgi:hypothetical protein
MKYKTIRRIKMKNENKNNGMFMREYEETTSKFVRKMQTHTRIIQ